MKIDLVRKAAQTAVGAALEDELRARLERRVLVVDLGRVGEVAAIEVGVDGRPRLGLVVASARAAARAAGRSPISAASDRGQSVTQHFQSLPVAALLVRRLHPGEQLLVLLAELLLVLRAHLALDRRDLLLLAVEVGVGDPDLLLLEAR